MIQFRIASNVNRTEANHPILNTPCWVWRLSKARKGYGWIKVNGKQLYAHRVSYEAFRAPIPDGMVIDHLCRNTSCVNPSHLESVTNAENLRRGVSFSAINTRKTHCPQGHEYTEENTNMGSARLHRECRTCRRNKMRIRRAHTKVVKK